MENNRVIAELAIGKKEIMFKEKDPMDNDDIKEILGIMLNPWMETETRFEITTEDGVNWVCQHYVGAYCGLSGYLYGYGDNPRQALEDCENLLNRLSEQTNEEEN